MPRGVDRGWSATSPSSSSCSGPPRRYSSPTTGGERCRLSHLTATFRSQLGSPCKLSEPYPRSVTPAELGPQTSPRYLLRSATTTVLRSPGKPSRSPRGRCHHRFLGPRRSSQTRHLESTSRSFLPAAGPWSPPRSKSARSPRGEQWRGLPLAKSNSMTLDLSASTQIITVNQATNRFAAVT